MIRRSVFLLLLVALPACGGGATTDAGPVAPTPALCTSSTENPADAVPWPNADFASLQALIDWAPPGATIAIEPGIHEIADPILVDHKVDLRIVGSGSDVDDPAGLTQLNGGEPLPVVVEWDLGGQDHVVSPAADEVLGMFTCRGSSVSIRSMRLTGWDAGIVTRDLDGTPTTLCAEKLTIAGTGRGILILGTGDASLQDLEIADTSWNALSAAPRYVGPLKGFTGIDIARVSLVDPVGAGMYFADTTAVVNGATVLRAGNGGIVTWRCHNAVSDCIIVNCAKAGVLLVESRQVAGVDGCWIVGTRAFPGGLLGDGIALFESDVDVGDNTINGPARAGISLFGGAAWLEDNTITCASFDLIAEAFDGQPATLNDAGGNTCGCGSGLASCDREGGAPEPPAPVGGLE